MLELKNVGKVFNPGTVNEKKALTAVNLHLAEGDFATIVGSNGAGTSTLFNAIAGAVTPATGSIPLAGQGLFLIPLGLFVSSRLGLDGALLAAPIADALTFALSLGLALREFRSWKKMGWLSER